MKRSLIQKVQKETRWCYISGRIKAVERDLISQSHYQSLISSQYHHDLIRAFSDTYYKGLFRQEEDLFRYDEIINMDIDERLGWIQKYSPQTLVHDLFKVRTDLQHLKEGIKSYVSTLHQDRMVNEKEIMQDDLFHSLSSGPDGIPIEYEDALHAIVKKYKERKTLQSIDFEADRQMLAILYRIANGSESDLIKRYFYSFIDLKNLCALWRLKAIGQQRELMRDILFIHPESHLTLNDMECLYDRDHNKWAAELSSCGYQDIFSLEKTMVHGTIHLVEIERKCDDFLNDIVKGAKYIPFGVEVVFGYMAGFLTEVLNIKIIIVSKLNHLSEEVIRAKLRQVYV